MGVDFGLSLFRNYNNVEKLRNNTGTYKAVKQSRYRPGVAQRVPGN